MRKLIMFIVLFAAGMAAMAQSTYSYPFTTVGDCRGTFWNYTDTLTGSQTIDALIRVKSDNVMDVNVQVVMDEVSGSASATLSWLGSNDGVTYVAIAAASAITVDGSAWCVIDDFNYSYLKVLMTVTGTQTSTFKSFYSFREE